MKKTVLIIVANPSTHPTLNYPVGFWASELFHPIEVFNQNHINWEIASPDGGEVIMDPMSNPFDESQYSDWDEISKKYVSEPSIMDRLKNTPKLSDLNLDMFDAIIVAGGQSPMFTYDIKTELHQFFYDFYKTGKPTAALCHGTAILNFITDDNGIDFVKNKNVTGFTNAEEDAANAAVGTEVMPWRIENALTEKGANFEKSEPWLPFAVVDSNLITGQQNMSGEVTALKVVELLNNNGQEHK